MYLVDDGVYTRCARNYETMLDLTLTRLITADTADDYRAAKAAAEYLPDWQRLALMEMFARTARGLRFGGVIVDP